MNRVHILFAILLAFLLPSTAGAEREGLPEGTAVLPYKHATQFMLKNGPFGFGWHQNQNAYDWPMPVGTPVYAARSGVVAAAKSDSNRGGATENFKDDGNYVIIRHQDNTYANYLHFKQGGVFVRVGQSVKAGDKIGESGNTGWTTEPHLHFHIADKDGRTLPVTFLTARDKTETLVVQRSYPAFHPWCFSCSEGRFDGVNCVAQTAGAMNLKESKESYWYDKRFGALYRKPGCNEGRSDGVNCIVQTTSSLGLKESKESYWYDKRYGAIYKKAGHGCNEGRSDGVNCVIRTVQEMNLRGDKEAYWYDKKYGALYTKPSQCTEGNFDGVNCVVRTLPEMNLRGSKDAYWYDKKYGAVYSKPQDACTE